MKRDREYPELLEALRGKKVLIWTCTTCARLCGVGGNDSARAVADALAADGIEIAGVLSTSASCLDKKVIDKLSESESEAYDTILALTCNVGADRVGSLSSKDVLNPITTYAYGSLSDEGVPVIHGIIPVLHGCSERLFDGPFV